VISAAARTVVNKLKSVLNGKREKKNKRGIKERTPVSNEALVMTPLRLRRRR